MPRFESDDLRIAYEGFRWSHASILHNVVHELGPEHVVQVGIRDLCEEEHEAIRSSEGRISTLYDHEWAAVRLGGAFDTWSAEADRGAHAHQGRSAIGIGALAQSPVQFGDVVSVGDGEHPPPVGTEAGRDVV